MGVSGVLPDADQVRDPGTASEEQREEVLRKLISRGASKEVIAVLVDLREKDYPVEQ